MPCQGPSAEEQRTVRKQTKLFKLVLSVNERCKVLMDGEGFLRDDLSAALSTAIDKPWNWQYKVQGFELSGRKLFDVATNALCDFTKGASEEQLDVLMYNGRSKQARKYADWWGKHKEVDRKRLREDAERTARMEAQREADAFFEQVYSEKMADWELKNSCSV